MYKVSVEEYRFQAQYNWSRTQYLLIFNTAILAAASALSAQLGRGAALIYLLGAVTAPLSVVVVRTQHDYYRAARDRMKRVEAAYRIPTDQRIDTTATLGSRQRKISVNQVVYLLLSFLCLAHVVGVIALLLR